MNYDGSFKDALLVRKGKPIEKEKTNCNSNCVVLTIIHYAALKYHHMYILLQQSLNLMFNITTLLY